MKIKKTSNQWYKHLEDKIKIIDPDGWNRKNFDYSWFYEEITWDEFINRLIKSTIQCYENIFKL